MRIRFALPLKPQRTAQLKLAELPNSGARPTEMPNGTYNRKEWNGLTH